MALLTMLLYEAECKQIALIDRKCFVLALCVHWNAPTMNDCTPPIDCRLLAHSARVQFGRDENYEASDDDHDEDNDDDGKAQSICGATQSLARVDSTN